MQAGQEGRAGREVGGRGAGGSDRLKGLASAISC